MAPRRFEVGQHLRYDTAFEHFTNCSSILRPRDEGFDQLALQLADLNGCKDVLCTLKGDEGGDFHDADGRKLPSKIKLQQDVVTHIEEQLKEAKTVALAAGRLRVPSDDPVSSNAWLVEAARLDVSLSEAAALEERIATFEAAKQKIEEDRLRRRLRSPTGGGRMNAGRLVEVDGQRVDFVEGVATITDPRSPFDGWAVSRYRQEIVVPSHKRIRQQVLGER